MHSGNLPPCQPSTPQVSVHQHSKDMNALPVKTFTTSPDSASCKMAALSHDAVTTCDPPAIQSAAMRTSEWEVSSRSGVRWIRESVVASPHSPGNPRKTALTERRLPLLPQLLPLLPTISSVTTGTIVSQSKTTWHNITAYYCLH